MLLNEALIILNASVCTTVPANKDPANGQPANPGDHPPPDITFVLLTSISSANSFTTPNK